MRCLTLITTGIHIIPRILCARGLGISEAQKRCHLRGKLWHVSVLCQRLLERRRHRNVHLGARITVCQLGRKVAEPAADLAHETEQQWSADAHHGDLHEPRDHARDHVGEGAHAITTSMTTSATRP